MCECCGSIFFLEGVQEGLLVKTPAKIVSVKRPGDKKICYPCQLLPAPMLPPEPELVDDRDAWPGR